jgi:hypothetical protein
MSTTTVNTVLGRPYTILPSLNAEESESGNITLFESASLLLEAHEYISNNVINNMDSLMVVFI